MLRKKNLVVVGLATFNTEMLKISVSAMAGIKSKFVLIIHNDNPAVKLTKRDIRKLGYSGPVHIINSATNVGLRTARMRLADAAATHGHGAQWIIYVDDDDILLNVDIPPVGSEIFAIIQNSVSIRGPVSDLIKAAANPQNTVPDGENIILQRPHPGMRGTAVRISYMTAVAKLMDGETDALLREIDESLEFRPPVDTMMWNALNAFARKFQPQSKPIFMDAVNYIQNDIDTHCVKYGHPGICKKNHQVHMERALARYARVMDKAMA